MSDTDANGVRAVSDDATVRALAAKAASELRRRGWLQGRYSTQERCSPDTAWPVCLVGAVRAAATGDPYCDDVHGLTWTLVDYLASALASDVQPGRKSINEDIVTRWNDRPERKAEEVLGLLDSVASGG